LEGGELAGTADGCAPFCFERRGCSRGIKVAVDAGDYDRAAALLDVARSSIPKEASVAPPASARGKGGGWSGR
jgi:hypothetical protein